MPNIRHSACIIYIAFSLFHSLSRSSPLWSRNLSISEPFKWSCNYDHFNDNIENVFVLFNPHQSHVQLLWPNFDVCISYFPSLPFSFALCIIRLKCYFSGLKYRNHFPQCLTWIQCWKLWTLSFNHRFICLFCQYLPHLI